MAFIVGRSEASRIQNITTISSFHFIVSSFQFIKIKLPSSPESTQVFAPGLIESYLYTNTSLKVVQVLLSKVFTITDVCRRSWKEGPGKSSVVTLNLSFSQRRQLNAPWREPQSGFPAPWTEPLTSLPTVTQAELQSAPWTEPQPGLPAPWTAPQTISTTIVCHRQSNFFFCFSLS